MEKEYSTQGHGTRDILITRTIKRLKQAGKRAEADKLERSLNAPTLAQSREEIEKLKLRLR